MTHWCRDIQRDEAVRAAEDNRSGPLPTLEEAISRAGQFVPQEPSQGQKCTERESVTERRPVPPGGGGNVTGGLRTERVTLEITHDATDTAAEWPWKNILAGDDVWGFWPDKGESVRVVEEAHFDDLAQVAMERDAAIRERDKLRGEITSVLDRSEFASTELTRLRNRVAELESAAKLSPTANADGESNHAAPAASGAAGTEPVAWGRRSKATGELTFVTFHAPVCHWSHEYIVPLYERQPLPPGTEAKEANRE
jgi:hypothetical protein